MDPSRTDPPMIARESSASTTSVSAPARDRLQVWERLARPGTPEEYLDGELRLKMGSKPPHAHRHIGLAYVLQAHVAEGYQGAVEMLTRTDHDSDFAPDASVHRIMPDPLADERPVEDLAFEVCSEQSLEVPTRKAKKLIARGVRRVFCIVVAKTGKGKRKVRQRSHLLEWTRRLDDWSPVGEDTVIEDPCLDPPMPVRAILEATAEDDAVAHALLVRGNTVLRKEMDKNRAEGEAKGRAEGLEEGEAKGRAAGLLEGRAQTLVAILEDQDVVSSDEDRQRILECRDPERLKIWTRRVLTITAIDDLWQDQDQ